jgi:hypothetical protein
MISTPPDSFITTRNDLHRLARYVITPRRQQIDGSERLTQLPGGFGTPTLANDMEMRVDGVDLVVRIGATTTREPVTTLRRAGELVGTAPSDHTAKPDIPQLGDVDELLAVDPVAAAYLARWFEFASAAMAALRNDEASTDATDTVLWSHHFDPSIEVLSDHRKASYGGSPGDGSVAEPYLYVAPWAPEHVADDGYWNADGYTGSILRVSELVTAADPLRVGVEFLRQGRDILARS